MRKLAILAPALISACSTAPAAPRAQGEAPGRACQSAGLERFAGQPATSETGAAILRASNATVLRWVPHGTIITMEFRADRVTVWLSAGNRINRVNCG
jgi:peptidase inhibitor I78 family protein